jgi:membrane dipeptidase
MQGLVGPSAFPSYTYLPGLASALLDIGFSAIDVGKLLGANYVRIFTQSMT